MCAHARLLDRARHAQDAIIPCSMEHLSSPRRLNQLRKELICQLSIHRQRSSFPIAGIGGENATHTRGKAVITLRSIHSTAKVTLQAHVLRKLTSVLPSFESQPQKWPHIANLKLADPEFLKPRAIDIIIGVDTYGQITKPNIIKHSPLAPIAQLSIFGWLVHGPVTAALLSASTVHHAIKHEDTALQELLTKFWIQEELPTDRSTSLTPEEQE
ncbi:hypothetical protein KPH14_012876, partial [Odynerus spinipes]